MANYNLILPPITEVCRHIGVKNSMVGIIVGACDIATVFGTVGELPCHHPAACMLTQRILAMQYLLCNISTLELSPAAYVPLLPMGVLPGDAVTLYHPLACRPPLLFAGYSIWTNTNYKNPLIASAVACLLGNVCYCLSYDLGAVWLLFLARLITGFGEPPNWTP